MKRKSKKPDIWAKIICENAVLSFAIILIHLALKYPVLSIPVMVIAFGLILAWDGGVQVIEGSNNT